MIEELVCTAPEMREIEADAVAHGDTWEALMDRAGKQVADGIASWWPGARPPRVLSVAGPGNNGGDALVVARLLSERGWPVRVLVWGREAAKDTRLQKPLLDRNVPVESMPPFDPKRLDALLSECDLIVDGIFGTGLKRDVEGDLANLIRTLNASGKRIVGVDIPSGVDSDTGAVRGVALHCHLTVTVGHYKYGHFQPPGAGMAGEIYLGDIGLSDVTSKRVASGELLTDRTVAALLPERPEDSNKGTFGKAMIVAGSINYIGAAALATQGAMRSGAGLVTLACAADLLPILAVKLTESTFLPLPTDLGVISERAVEKLRGELEGYKALLIGCGLSTEKEAAAFVKGLFTEAQHKKPVEAPIGFSFVRGQGQSEKASGKEDEDKGALPPLVIDGDALNTLSEWEDWYKSVPAGSVLTPHPGEMARLLKSTVDEVQSDRVSAAKNAAKEWNQVVVLKGAGTLIAAPGGKVYVSPFSNPVLATAGSGDVLAGLIAGLLAQGLAPVDAARAGVYLHGMAGEMLRDELGSAGGLAGDLPPLLPRVQRRLREGK